MPIPRLDVSIIMGFGVQARAMSFHTKYELEQLVSDDPTKTFRAGQVSSGAEVFLHLLDKSGENCDPSPVIGKVRDLQSLIEGTIEEGVILEVGDDQGSPYVATRLLESFDDLEIWLGSQWIEAGKKSKTAKSPHTLGWNEYVSVQIEVTAHRLIHRLRQDGPWTEIDRRAEAGGDFTNGRMGFNIPRRDRIALRSFSFTPW